jgi:hypothetical protein
MLLLRYLDVWLVLATAPFVFAGGMPTLGYVVAACAWLLTRAGAAFVHEHARRSPDARIKAGLHVAAMMGRIWIIVAAVVLARFAGGRDDGIMAAALSLGAFTVYFAMSLATREGPLRARPGAQGRPSPS